MKNKILAIAAIAAASISTSTFAGFIYLGPGIFAENISAKHSSYRDIQPRFALGYGEQFDMYVLAAELGAVPATAVISDSVNAGAVSAKTNQTVSASLLPGYIVCNNLLAYVRLGVMESKFSALNSWRKGALAGVGIQTAISANWDVRAEYVYGVYKGMAYLGSPRSNQVGITALYRINI